MPSTLMPYRASIGREQRGFDFQKTIRLPTRAALNKATGDRVRIPGRHHPMYGLLEFETTGHQIDTQVEYLNKDIRSRQRGPVIP
jgi:hypothetical protein